MDERFYRRFESFTNSLEALEEVRQRDLADSFRCKRSRRQIQYHV